MNTSTTDIKTKVEVLLVLENGYTVSKKLFDEIYDHVTDDDLPLLPNVECTLKTLCGSDYWYSLTMSDRRLAGMCMAHMVRSDLVRYAFAGKICQSPKVYSMI